MFCKCFMLKHLQIMLQNICKNVLEAVTCKIKIFMTFLYPWNSRGKLTALKHFCKCFSMLNTCWRKAVATCKIKHFYNIFTRDVKFWRPTWSRGKFYGLVLVLGLTILWHSGWQHSQAPVGSKLSVSHCSASSSRLIQQQTVSPSLAPSTQTDPV